MTNGCANSKSHCSSSKTGICPYSKPLSINSKSCPRNSKFRCPSSRNGILPIRNSVRGVRISAGSRLKPESTPMCDLDLSVLFPLLLLVTASAARRLHAGDETLQAYCASSAMMSSCVVLPMATTAGNETDLKRCNIYSSC